MSHGHGHNSGRKRQSTLLNPVKNVELYRVSEETRIKVAQDTNRIKEENRQLYETSRKRIMKKERERLYNNNSERQKMIAHWTDKSKNSPLHTDQVKMDERREKILATKRKEERTIMWKQNVIDGNMPCLDKFDPVPKSKFGLFEDKEVQLALALRKHGLDGDTAQKAKSLVEQLMYHELKEISNKFPALQSKFEATQEYDHLRPAGSRIVESTDYDHLRSQTSKTAGKAATPVGSTGGSSRSAPRRHVSTSGTTEQGLATDSSTASGISAAPLPTNDADAVVMKKFEADLSDTFGSKYV